MASTCPVCERPIQAALDRCPDCSELLRSGKFLAPLDYESIFAAAQAKRRRYWLGRRLLPQPSRPVEPSPEFVARLGRTGEPAPRLTSLAASLDGDWMAAGTYDGKVWVWPGAGGTSIALAGTHARISSVLFTLDGSTVLAGGAGWQDHNPITRWTWPGGPLVGLASREAAGQTRPGGGLFADGAGSVVALALSRAGDWLAVARGGWRVGDTSMTLWAVASEICLHTLPDLDGPITALAWSPSVDLLALGSGGWRGQHGVRLWQPMLPQSGLLQSGHTAPVTALAWSPDGSQLASGGQDGTLRLWDERGQPRDARFASAWISALAWHPAGQLLAAGCGDGAVRVWDLGTEEPPRVLIGHTDRTTGVVWLPGGQGLISSGWDGSLIRWHLGA